VLLHACMSTMAKCYFWITISPESATCLYTQNACKGHARYLASVASPHSRQCLTSLLHECRDRVRPRCSRLPIGKCFSSNINARARVIPRLTDLELCCESVTVLPDSFFGGIRTMSHSRYISPHAMLTALSVTFVFPFLVTCFE
jgi:hypothetical protein